VGEVLKLRMTTRLKRNALVGLLLLGSGSFLACQEDLTSTLGEDLLPVSAVTVEVRLPFSEFAENLQVWGGYGRAIQLSTGIVARAYEDLLDARVLVGWYGYPSSAFVQDTTGSSRTDTLITFVGGKVVARFDTLTSVLDGPVTLSLGAIGGEWDPGSVTWTLAVDSVGESRAWPEEGAGPVVPLSTAEWDPAEGDSVVFQVDSAGVAIWADTSMARRGARVEALTEGVRLDMTSMRLSLSTRPSINPDTLVDLDVSARSRTFVYHPPPEVGEGSIIVGGVPAWRTVLSLNLPKVLNGPPDLCAKVGCPLTLTARSLVSASLVLRTEAPPPAFQPSDSILLDVRAVLEPSRLPKSPLGYSLAGPFGVPVPPGYFGEEAGSEVILPLGAYVEQLIADDPGGDYPTPRTVALLSSFEPLSLFFGAFHGPGSAYAPELRLILTLGEEVRIR
jgi:hypothetical protein